MTKPDEFRLESDSLGEVRIPKHGLWGASTQRAVDNFPVSGQRFPRAFIAALGMIKEAAARVNQEDGYLDFVVAEAIIEAAREVAEGRLDEHFVVDIFQTGSGTSTNMNANEVIANRACEILKSGRGDRDLVHPNDHVNLGQSSNDVIPTATHLAAMLEIRDRLLPALILLRQSLRWKARKFRFLVKTGRTHLQDATPVTLGQEFSGYASQLSEAINQVRAACRQLSHLALGGTAVGTGINTDKDFAARVIARLSETTGLRLRESANHFRSQSTIDPLVSASAALRLTAVTLTKIANDIRWMGSGPHAGLGEITLPAVQPGSSIMPGKVNPVMAEALLQVCAQVIGNDATIAVAGLSGNFELNVMQPVAAYNLLNSTAILANAVRLFATRCVDGIEATGRGPALVTRGLSLATALVPAIGYDAAAAIAKEAAASNRTIIEVAEQKTGLSRDELARILDPIAMTANRDGASARRTRTVSLKGDGADIDSLYTDLGGEA